MKVLIAGGGGYIGSHLAWDLHRAGEVPIILDNWRGGRPDRLAGLDVVTADADERSRARIAFEHFKFDACVFAVAPPAVPRPARFLPEQLLPSLLGSAVVLGELCARFRVGKVVVLSSASVYGATPPEGVDEERPLEGSGLAASAARSLEGIFGAYAREGAFSLTVLRLFSVAGADSGGKLGEEHLPERHLVPCCLTALRDGRPFTLWGEKLGTPDGTAIRDFVHVLDVVKAVKLSLDHDEAQPVRTYNVSSGVGNSVRRVLEAAEGITGRKLTVAGGGRDEGVVACSVGRSERIRSELRWEPAHSSLEKILKTQWEYLLKRGEDARGVRGAEEEEPPVERFGEVAVKLGFVRPEDVERALRVQKEDAARGRPRRLLGLVMLEEGIITNAQLIEILRYYDRKDL